MKLGYCANMLSTKSDGTGFERLRDVRQAGFDYVELPMVQMQNMGLDYIRKIADELNRLGLVCRTSNNFLSGANRITGPTVDYMSLEKYLENVFLCADILGIDTFVVGSPGARDVPDGFSREHAYEQLISFFRFLSDRLPSGKVAAIEPVCKKESNIIHTVAEGIELMHLVDRDNICVLADYFHMENENEQPDILEQCGSKLAHIHFSPIEPRSLPLVLDENMKLFIKQLKKTGYEKRISLEARANSLDEMSAACSAIRDCWGQTI